VDIIRRREGIPDTLHAMLVRAVQDGGTYAVSLDAIVLGPGAYTIRLTTNEKSIEQQIRVGP
jgi:hypothetical protein